MKYINPKEVCSFFETLNNSLIKYVLIKNNGNYLPDKLPYLKDIDILVHPENRLLFYKLMRENGFVSNPYYAVRRKNGYIFLYPMDDGDWFTKNKVIVEVFYQINVHALRKNAIIPLDESINQSIWNNRVWNSEKNWWQVDDKNLIVYLLARAIFDKKEFNSIYIAEIKHRKNLLNEEDVIKKLYLVFFRFTDRLIYLVENERYSEIIHEYIKFSDY